MFFCFTLQFCASDAGRKAFIFDIYYEGASSSARHIASDLGKQILLYANLLSVRRHARTQAVLISSFCMFPAPDVFGTQMEPS